MARRYDDDDDDDDDRDDDDDDDREVRRKRKPKRRRGARAIDALAVPSICLMSVIGLHLAVSCISLPFYILALVGHGIAAAQGHISGTPVNIGLNIVGLLVQGFMLFGAIQMKRGEMYGVSMATAILSCIPCFCSSCAILGIPFGIWALILLMDEDVKASFTS